MIGARRIVSSVSAMAYVRLQIREECFSMLDMSRAL
jgi:hypothetical protein